MLGYCWPVKRGVNRHFFADFVQGDGGMVMIMMSFVMLMLMMMRMRVMRMMRKVMVMMMVVMGGLMMQAVKLNSEQMS